MNILPILVLLCAASSWVSSAHIEPILSQFQETDDSGAYKFSYESGLERKSEYRTPDGRTHGSYSYLDKDDGTVHLVKYTSGIEGFRVETSNLPVAGAQEHVIPLHKSEVLHETPEVIEARRQHAAAHAAALAFVPKSQHVPTFRHVHTAPVSGHFEHSSVSGDTPEVVAAKAQHAAAHAEVLRVLPKISETPSITHHPHHTQEHIYRHVHTPTHFGHSGILGDTPEVVAAKAQHAAAHAEALRVLPVVPQEVNYHQHHSEALRHDHSGPKFAEDVPRSALGETPEVAAAREAHLATYNKVKSGLPELTDTHTVLHH